MGILDSAAAIALNHLLATEAWARDRLAPFASEVVELRFDPLPPVRLALAEGGYARIAEPSLEATLVISGSPAVLLALTRGEEQLMRAVKVSGNDRLAEEILVLLRHLRWDFEEDLSRVFGDALARRLVGGARDLATWQAEAARRLAENVVEYAVEERGLLIARPEFDAFATEVARLRDDLARLQQRIERQDRPADGGGR